MVSRRIVDGLVAASNADAKAATLCSAEGLHHIAAFHWQQAAEKRLKAALAAVGLPVEPTHDLVGLCRKLSAYLPGSAWPPEEDLLALTRVAVEARCPLRIYDFRDPEEVVTVSIAQRCRSTAETVMAEADRLLAWARETDPPELEP